MDWEKVANQASGTILALALIYLLADVQRENRDMLIEIRDKLDSVYEVVSK
jgi:hypothetical protein